MTAGIVICVRDAPGVKIVKGSVLRECPNCRHAIWVAPSSLRLLDATDAALTCLVCAGPELDAADEVEVTLAPGAEDELREELDDRP